MNKQQVTLALLLVFFFAQTAISQQRACPKVLDNTMIKLYQPTNSATWCEYDNNGKCINSFPNDPKLEKEMHYFDHRLRRNGIQLIWQTKDLTGDETFTLLRSRDGQNYHAIAEVQRATYGDYQYSFLDNLPVLGNNHYILKKVDKNGNTLLGSPQVVYNAVGVCQVDLIGTQQNETMIRLDYYVDNYGVFQMLITDTAGNEKSRKDIAMIKGKNALDISLPFNGIYFVTLTNGFSSTTNLVVQANGMVNKKEDPVAKNN